MAELKCAVQNCSYNANERCSKGDIMVGGKHASCSAETCCESFTEKKEQRWLLISAKNSVAAYSF